jgi:dihydrodipicolinate synthase/N-acetylneuraminate lyase
MADPISLDDLRGVYAVPPLPRRAERRRTLDFDAAERIAAHIEAGGITRFLYGGNAFLYHVTLDEYEALLGWLSHVPASRWAIPSLGPSYGRAIDQAKLLRRHAFRCAMMLPCGDPRDACGIEAGFREVADAAGMPLVVYIKSDDALGNDRDAGLDVVARLLDDGTAVSVKYAIVRERPEQDAYLDGLLRRTDRRRIISGMGERPAVVHLRDFDLGGLTTGSGCIAPRACQRLFESSLAGGWDEASELRARFMPLEDLRDAWGPARVLHHAVELSGISPTGPIPPFVSPLDRPRLEQLAPVARALREQDA